MTPNWHRIIKFRSKHHILFMFYVPIHLPRMMNAKRIS